LVRHALRASQREHAWHKAKSIWALFTGTPLYPWGYRRGIVEHQGVDFKATGGEWNLTYAIETG
jgi:hypothetical protein